MLQFNSKNRLIDYHKETVESFKNSLLSGDPIEEDKFDFITLEQLAADFILEFKQNLYYTNVDYTRYFTFVYFEDFHRLLMQYIHTAEVYTQIRDIDKVKLINEDDRFYTLCTFLSSLESSMYYMIHIHKTLKLGVDFVRFDRYFEDYEHEISLDEMPNYNRLIGTKKIIKSDKGAIQLKCREIILIHKYKSKAIGEELIEKKDWKAFALDNGLDLNYIARLSYTIHNKSTYYKTPTESEMKTVIDALRNEPKAQQLALDDELNKFSKERLRI